MDFAELRDLAVSGESDTVEFKRSTGQLNRAGESLCAFLNGQGGTVLIGVTSEGRVVGQRVEEGTLSDVGAMLARLEPPAPVQIGRVAVPESEHEVLVLEAPSRPDLLPFVFDGRPYVRLGTNTARMPQERYQELLLARSHSRRRWENQRAEAISVNDLDHEQIVRTIRLGAAAGRLPDAPGETASDIVARLQLTLDGALLNAAVALFGRFDGNQGLAAEYPQCLLQLARFKGTGKAEFLDQRQVHGHCFAVLDEAMLFLRRHLPVAGRIQPGLFERIDEPLFPLEALREALVNAVCHRDYALAGGSVRVAIFDDRLEIWSDGLLPPGVELEDLKRQHASRPRNPLIADVLFRRGLIERWGRGTQRIVELCVEAGHPEPEFVEESGAVGVRFLPSRYVAPLRVSQDLSDRQREILGVLAGAGSVPLREIHGRVSGAVAKRTLQEDLTHLRKLGLVRSTGWGRGARYQLLPRR